MKEIIKTLSLDLWKKSNARLVFAKQNDRKIRKVKVKLTAAGEPYPVSGDTIATVEVRRADGVSKIFAADVTEDGCVMVTLSLWMLSSIGVTSCCISLYDADSNKLSSANFAIEVDEALCLEGSISSDPNYSVLTDMMAKIAAYSEAEKGRVSAEEQRVFNEGQRELSETERDEGEQRRCQAEAAREQAEEARVSAENERQSSEELRSLAEEAREQAEVNREEQMAAFEEEKVRFENRIVSVEQRSASAEDMVASLNDRVASAEETVASFNDRVASAEETVASLNVRMATAEENLSLLWGRGGSITLSPADFGTALALNAAIEGLGDCDAVFFTPQNTADREAMNKCELFVSPSDTQGRVCFSASSLPQNAIALYYFICRGGTE